MHKVSGLFFAAAALTALAAVLLMGGCKQQITPSTLITNKCIRNGTDAVPDSEGRTTRAGQHTGGPTQPDDAGESDRPQGASAAVQPGSH